jgi:hypothetical protein
MLGLPYLQEKLVESTGDKFLQLCQFQEETKNCLLRQRRVTLVTGA